MKDKERREKKREVVEAAKENVRASVLAKDTMKIPPVRQSDLGISIKGISAKEERRNTL